MIRQVHIKGRSDKEYSPKVLQFGGGNFIRGFADWMIDILNKEAEFNGSVIVVKPQIKGDYYDLKRQKGAFHVVLNRLENGEARQDIHLVDCTHSIIHPFNDLASLMNSVAEPTIRFIISNTTEAGIFYKEKDIHQSSDEMNYPEMLLEWLYERFHYFQGAADKGCIILPLELIENNGDFLKECVLKYAKLWQKEPQFIEWLENHNYFCNNLVDRIITGFPKNPEPYYQKVGAVDKKIVMGESYHSWLIQAPEEIRKELPFHKTDLNVEFVDDLTIARAMKVKIFNGGHIALAPIGMLARLDTVSDAVDNETTSSFLQKMWEQDILPTIDAPLEKLTEYTATTLTRFQNSAMRHQLRSIAINATTKFTAQLLPFIKEYLQTKKELPKRTVFAFAALICLYEGERDGKKFKLKDERSVLSFFKKTWASFDEDYQTLTTAFLQNQEVWGEDLTKVEGLLDLTATYIQEIDELGILESIKNIFK